MPNLMSIILFKNFQILFMTLLKVFALPGKKMNFLRKVQFSPINPIQFKYIIK